jgi:hypothetical protein
MAAGATTSNELMAKQPLVPGKYARVQLWMTALFLLSYGIYGLVAAMREQLWDYSIGAVASIVAAAAVAAHKSWARFLVYAIAALLVGNWLWYVWLAISVGYFRHAGVAKSALSLIPGIGLALLAGFCSYVVSVQLRPGEKTIRPKTP